MPSIKLRHARLVALALFAATGLLGCGGDNHAPLELEGPDASAPLQPSPATPVIAKRRPHDFDKLPPEERARLFNEMEDMGALASGLQPAHDTDAPGRNP